MSHEFVWDGCKKGRELLEVKLMKKMLKIMAMLLVIATVVFAAGCAEQTEEGATEEEAATE